MDDLQKITIPTLIFQSNGQCAEPTFLKDASTQYSILPKAELFAVDGACHDPWYSHTKIFFEKCMAFVTKLK